MAAGAARGGRGGARGRLGGGRGRGRGRAKAEREEDVDPGEMSAQGGGCEEATATETVSKDQPGGLAAWEERLWSEGYEVVAGTDEAGRGPLAGPVVAASFAVLAREDKEVHELLALVNDSKLMTAAQREQAFERLTDSQLEGRVVWAVAESSVEEIDEGNILEASLGAMARSIRSLARRPDCVLVDGCNRPPDLLAAGETWTRGTQEERKKAESLRQVPKLSRWFSSKSKEPILAQEPAEDLPWRPNHVEAVISGDGLVPSISAASVLAKVHRDRLMARLHEEYPVYGFAAHQGYGTSEHLEAIRLHGPCPAHRRSFAPVREALGLEPLKGKSDGLLPGQKSLSSLLTRGPSRVVELDETEESTPALASTPLPDSATSVAAKRERTATEASEKPTPPKRARVGSTNVATSVGQASAKPTPPKRAKAGSKKIAASGEKEMRAGFDLDLVHWECTEDGSQIHLITLL